MITGARTLETILRNDYLILSNLISYKLSNNNTFKQKYPKYIHNTFHSFTNNIEKIKLNLHIINTEYKQLKSLIFYTSNGMLFVYIIYENSKNVT